MLRAMIEQESRPKLEQLGRWGPTDLGDFDHVCLGHRAFGKVKIDCSFKFTKSKWGTLGGNPGKAGGIVYLDLNFQQPPDCKMTHATVSVTVDDRQSPGAQSSSPLAAAIQHREHQGSQTSVSPVHITTFGPKCITGQPRMKMVKKTINFTPHVEALGNGAGGIGVDHEKTFLHTSRWSLRGNLQPDETHQSYKTVQWELTENDLDHQPTHSDVFKTAFAFAHGRKPVVLKVDIQGRLESRRDRAKYRFSSGVRDSKKPKTAAVLLTFPQSMPWSRCLRGLEQGLERDMENENYQQVPVELPDPQRAFFGLAPMPSNLPSSPVAAPSIDAGPELQCQAQVPTTLAPPPPLNHGAQGLLPSTVTGVAQILDEDALTEPTLANLAHFARPSSTSPEEDDVLQQGTSRQRASVSSRTTETMEYSSQSDDSTLVGDSSSAVMDEKETMIQMLDLPVVLMLLRLIVWMMNMVGQRPASEKGRKVLPETPPRRRVILGSSPSSL